MINKQLRIRRLVDSRTGRFLIVPMDHGMSSGPINGIIDISKTMTQIGIGGATAAIMHKGLVPYAFTETANSLGLIVHLSAGTDLSIVKNAKQVVTTVEEAIKVGADAVSIHLNLGADTENEMLREAGKIADECIDWGIPLLAMVYPRGRDINNQFDVKYIKICARVAAELGADIVKTNYTGDINSFREVVAGTPIPVVIAGGPKINSDMELLQMVRDSIDAGGKGVSIGRNIFQHTNVVKITQAISAIIKENMTAGEAYAKFLGDY